MATNSVSFRALGESSREGSAKVWLKRGSIVAETRYSLTSNITAYLEDDIMLS